MMDSQNDSTPVSVSRNEKSLCQPQSPHTPNLKNVSLRVAPPSPGLDSTHATTEIFQSQRARLFGLAYRMLGSRMEAEDLLQDAYLRWHQSATQDIRSPVAFLVTLTTRL